MINIIFFLLLFPIHQAFAVDTYIAGILQVLNNGSPSAFQDLHPAPSCRTRESQRMLAQLRNPEHLGINDEIELEIPEQSILIEHIVKYLKSELNAAGLHISEEERNGRIKTIKMFEESGGECAGLSLLWAYARRISEEPQRKGHEEFNIQASNKAQDNLAKWDEKKKYNFADKILMDRFILQVAAFQRPQEFSQVSAPSKSQIYNAQYHFKDSHGRKMSDDKYAVLVGDLGILADRLKKLIQPKRMIFLGSQKHGMGVYKNSKTDQLYFYDPNLGETRPANTQELVQTFHRQMLELTRLRRSYESDDDQIAADVHRLSVTIMRFSNEDREQYKYPYQHELGLSYLELSRLIAERPGLLKRSQDANVKSLFDSLYRDQIMQGLLDPSIKTDFKKALRETAERKLKIDDIFSLIWRKGNSAEDEAYIRTAFENYKFEDPDGLRYTTERKVLREYLQYARWTEKTLGSLKNAKIVLSVLKDRLGKDGNYTSKESTYKKIQHILDSPNSTQDELEWLASTFFDILAPPQPAHGPRL